jgi:MYXO-CTERM domain-containing protein
MRAFPLVVALIVFARRHLGALGGAVMALLLSAGCGGDETSISLGTAVAALEWEQQAVLTADDTLVGDQFGFAVAVVGDTIVVGAPENEENGFSSGAAYVFTRSGGSWALQAKLMPSDATTYERFGSSVDFDGETAVIGAVWGYGAYVFRRTGGTWVEEGKLTAPSPLDWELGARVAISGERVLVSAPGHSDVGAWGAAHVFVRAGTAWSHEATLTASSPPTVSGLDIYGTAIDLSGDTAIVSQSRWGFGNRAYIYTRSGSVWTEEAVLEASDPAAAEHYATAVALVGDNAFVSASTFESGVVYEYERSAGQWFEQTPLASPIGTQFGTQIEAPTADRLYATSSNVAALHMLTRGDDGWSLDDSISISGWSAAANDSTVVSGDFDALVGGAVYVLVPEEGGGGAGGGGGTGAGGSGGAGGEATTAGSGGGEPPVVDPCDDGDCEPAANSDTIVNGACGCRTLGAPTKTPPPLAFALLSLLGLAIRSRRRR